MSARSEVIALLEGNGFVLEPFGHVAPGKMPFLIVRPGGIAGERNVVEVWVVNPPSNSMYDPDEGLEEDADKVYDLLRHHLLDPSVAPGPPYNPTGRNPHSTMLLTGVYPNARGIG